MTARECYARCGQPRVRPSAYCPSARPTSPPATPPPGRVPLPAGTARCPACRELFQAEAYDLHRRDGQCTNPATAGLIQADGVWTTPAPADTP